MKYVKIIIGTLLSVSAFVQLIKVITIYFTQPADKWPVGAELGTGLMLVAGILIIRSGIRYKKTKGLNN